VLQPAVMGVEVEALIGVKVRVAMSGGGSGVGKVSAADLVITWVLHRVGIIRITAAPAQVVVVTHTAGPERVAT